MSEEDVRGGLRDAVAEEPPLDFDPDALVAAARQQVRRRRALMAAGVATVAVAVAAVALPVALGRPATYTAGDQPTVSAPTTTTTTQTPAQAQWPPPGIQPPDYTTDKLRARGEQMAAHLRQTAPAVLSNVSEVKVSDFGGEATGQYYEGQTNVNGTIDYMVDGAWYSIVVQVWVPGGANDLFDTTCGKGSCQKIGEQDGGALMAVTEDLGQYTDGGKISSVYHFRKNGSVVQVAAYNYQLSGAPKAMSTIPITTEQLTTLAIDPELGL